MEDIALKEKVMDRKDILLKLKSKMSKVGVIRTAMIVGVSPGHLHHIVHHPKVYPLSDKIRKKVVAAIERGDV